MSRFDFWLGCQPVLVQLFLTVLLFPLLVLLLNKERVEKARVF